MAMESAAELQAWIDRLNAGDKTARDELIRRAARGCAACVGKMMQKYDRLERWVDIDDVLQNAIVRLFARWARRRSARCRTSSPWPRCKYAAS